MTQTRAKFALRRCDFDRAVRREIHLRWSQFCAFLRTLKGLKRAFLALFCTLTAPLVAAAQGCAMCYQNAAASGPSATSALRHAILILLIPAASLFLGIFGLIFRRDRSR